MSEETKTEETKTEEAKTEETKTEETKAEETKTEETKDTVEIKYSDNTPIETLFKQYPEYKDTNTINKYKTVKDLLEGHKELSSKIGDMISLPKEDASEEEKTAALEKIYHKLGKPESPDKYELSNDVPEGLQLNENLQKNFKDMAHKIHLTKSQATALQDFHNNSISEILSLHNTNTELENEKSVEIQVKELKNVWGSEFKTRTQVAINTSKQLLSAETLEYLDKTGLGNNANFIKDFYNISKQFSGDKAPILPTIVDDENNLAALETECLTLRKDSTLKNDKVKQARLKDLTERRAAIKYKEKK